MVLFLPNNFFSRSTLVVAEELLGKVLCFQGKKGIITETEAYIGQDDPACHAAVGKTKRTEVMFGSPGYSYVYLIYGMYHCLNIVTEYEGFQAAVLIRGIHVEESTFDLQGPGKLCRYFGITTEHNKQDMTRSNDFCVLDTPHKPSFIQTPRIGIKKGTDKLWRFVAQ